MKIQRPFSAERLKLTQILSYGIQSHIARQRRGAHQRSNCIAHQRQQSYDAQAVVDATRALKEKRQEEREEVDHPTPRNTATAVHRPTCFHKQQQRNGEVEANTGHLQRGGVRSRGFSLRVTMFSISALQRRTLPKTASFPKKMAGHGQIISQYIFLACNVSSSSLSCCLFFFKVRVVSTPAFASYDCCRCR